MSNYYVSKNILFEAQLAQILKPGVKSNAKRNFLNSKYFMRALCDEH
jgi:hypothetical protein